MNQTFTLVFNEKEEIYFGRFQGVAKSFIQLLKYQGFLEDVTSEFIESLPETFDGELNIVPEANGEDRLWVFFYTEMIATEEMKISTQKYLNRDIDINEDDDKLEFNIFVPKSSAYVQKSDEKEIILNF